MKHKLVKIQLLPMKSAQKSIIDNIYIPQKFRDVVKKITDSNSDV